VWERGGLLSLLVWGALLLLPSGCLAVAHEQAPPSPLLCPGPVFMTPPPSACAHHPLQGLRSVLQHWQALLSSPEFSQGSGGSKRAAAAAGPRGPEDAEDPGASAPSGQGRRKKGRPSKRT